MCKGKIYARSRERFQSDVAQWLPWVIYRLFLFPMLMPIQYAQRLLKVAESIFSIVSPRQITQ